MLYFNLKESQERKQISNREMCHISPFENYQEHLAQFSTSSSGDLQVFWSLKSLETLLFAVYCNREDKSLCFER